MKRNGHNAAFDPRYSRYFGGNTCTGCRDWNCRCGRFKLNRCVGCSKKLWNREGKRIRWGAAIREMCVECVRKVPPTVLMDGAK
jgi:hypothetical protein